MKKSALTILSLMFAIFSFSQTVDDGIKFLYYGKTKSAIQALEKVVASNPKDAKSIYWLGQAYLQDYEISGKNNSVEFGKAKSLFQQALQGGVNDPWIYVGSANVTLLENGDINQAKQQFEQAITASKGKKGAENADILNAIGRANAMGDSKQGDPQYGVDVLKRAAAIDTKNPDIDISLGINYLKMGSDHGGDAVQAFTDATVRDPKYAAGYARIGHIYQSQDNKSSMDDWYGRAINADANYGPVYYDYFDYYKDKDVNAAKEYLDKYIAMSDRDCQTAYFQADYLFRAGKYQESIAKADSMASGDCKTFDRLNMLYAYDYDRTGDSIKAKQYLQQFFAVTKAPEPDDYVLAAKVYTKFKGNEDTAAVYLQKAIQVDTIKRNEITYATTGVNIMTAAGKFQQVEYFMTLRAKLRGDTKLSEADFYKLGTSAIASIDVTKDSVTIMQEYATADSVGKAYAAAYPDKPQPYTIRVTAAKKADKDTAWGLAIEPITTANQFFFKDTASYGKTIFGNDYYLFTYFYFHAKGMARIEQYKKAIIYLDEMLLVTAPGSAEYNFAKDTGDKLKAAVDKYEKAKQNGGSTKPASGAGTGTKQK